jgi:predicted ATPase
MPRLPYLQQLSICWERIEDKNIYPYSIPSISSLKDLKFKTPVTFFVGENGSGKSTLLEAIAVHQGMNGEGGSRNFRFNTHENNISELSEQLWIRTDPRRPTDFYFLRAESFYNVATYAEEIGNFVHSKPYHEQSHGESFMDLVLDRFFGNGLYLLDEPEAALSPQRQLSLMVALNNLVNTNSQFIIATHSPILLAYPGATIYEFSEHGIQEISFKQTQHYQITKAFLDDPDGYIERFLWEKES